MVKIQIVGSIDVKGTLAHILRVDLTGGWKEKLRN